MLKSVTFLSFLILSELFNQIRTAVTIQQINRICDNGHFKITPISYNYTSVQEFYNDKYMKVNEDSKDFFISIITEGKVPQDKSPFTKKVVLYIFFFALAGIVLISKQL